MSSLFVDEDDVRPYVDEPHKSSDAPSQFTAEIAAQQVAGEIPVLENLHIKSNLPLKYQQEIVTDFVTRDGLLVMGRGLGWEAIVANILHVLNMNNLKERLPNPPMNRKSLLIVLNANEYESNKLNKELKALQEDDDETTNGMTVIGGEAMVADKRKAIYENGGVIAVTSRILVVDLLSEILKPTEINGIFILHAEKVRETSNESFIANLFRDGNQWGFIKAFSDEPESFTGFTPLATRLKNLRLSNVALWPRFHVEVSASLSFRNKKNVDDVRYVTEVNVALSYKMNKIQSAILYCLEACLNELRRHNPTLVTDYWDKENIQDNDFVRRIRLSLDSQWHRITRTSKQLVSDLATLKDLLRYLTTVDSLTYYQIVQSIIDSNVKSTPGSAGTMNLKSMSPWLNLEEATTIISYAKDRAFGKRRVVNPKLKKEESHGLEEEPQNEGQEEYNLEELPKWAQVGNLLDTTGPNSTTLIMCSSRRVAEQLERLVHNYRVAGDVNGRGYMIHKLNDYLSWKEISKLTKQINLELEKDQEEQEEEAQLSTSKTFTRGKNEISKRRRTRGTAAVANVGRLYSGTTAGRTAEAVELDDEIFERLHEEMNDEPDVVIKSENINTSKVVIECYDEKLDESWLNDLNPTHIIMYEPNLSFIRRVEIYQATHVSKPAKVFFMYYGTSTEEQKHLLTIKREKEAFTKLIREKANLGKHYETAEDNVKFKITTKDIMNTRIAGGMKFQGEDEEFRVIVDVREFRSSLPNLLYRIGTKVLPCMLTVGDYILTPKICVERKAIPDLISSFKSGRLYNQCEQMFRHYELPVLLIEFDESKSFSFEPFAEFKNYKSGGTTTNPVASNSMRQEIQSKLVMLLVSFPKLKIIWSSSPYETAQIFVELKRGQEPPDVSKAISKGLNDFEGDQPQLINEDAIDLIQCIPGITNMNYHQIIKRVKNIEELVALTKEEFKAILGNENGIRAYNFINKSVKS